MRTTISLPDDLLKAAKIRAAHEDRSMSSLLEEALRGLLSKADDAARADRADFTWPTFGGEGVARVDIDDNSAVLDAMDRR
jgi:plasmid stability protein